MSPGPGNGDGGAIGRDGSDTRHQREASRGAAAAAGMLGGAAAVLLALLLLSGIQSPRAASDERNFHLPTVRQFAAQWPRPDLSDYRSVTSPGYHLLLAAGHRIVSADVMFLRAVSAGITVLLVGVLGWSLGRRLPLGTAVAAGLPVVASIYVVSSGAWLLPDNLGWLTVLLALLLAYGRRIDRPAYAAAALLLAAGVFIRQINLWPWGVLLLAAVLAAGGEGERSGDEGSPSGRPELARSWRRRLLTMGLAGAPALLLLGWLYRLWGGLTPPAFLVPGQGALAASVGGTRHAGANPAVPAMVLSVLGATGPFFTGFAWRPLAKLRSAGGGPGRLLTAGLLVGMGIALLVPTSWDDAAGRSSGLWNVSRAFPVVGDRSVLITGLAAAGGATIAAGFAVLGRRDRWIWLAAWACFTAAQSANAAAWQRYYEPFCLIMLALAAGRTGTRDAERAAAACPPRWAMAGPCMLAALLGAVTVYSLAAPK
jgi:hypothetical protein